MQTEFKFNISRIAQEFADSIGAEIFREGVAEGEIGGIVKGKIEGRAEGRAEGIAEGKEIMIRFFTERLLTQGEKPEAVAKILGLSIQKVISIAKELEEKGNSE